MQEPLDNVDRMGATIVDLGNNFATTEAEITQFAERIAGAGKIVGLSTADIMAIGTALSSVGVEAEAGGTAVQMGLLEINKAVVESGDKLNEFARVSGLSAEDFKKKWDTDAAGAFQLFIEGLAREGDNAALVLDSLGLGGIRTSRAFLSLSNAGDLLSNTLSISKTAWEENTALLTEAEKRYATFDSQMKMLKNSFLSILVPLGEQLMPIILEFAQTIREEILPAIEPLIPQIGEFLSGSFKEFTKAIIPLLPNLFKLLEITLNFATVIGKILKPALDIIMPILDKLIFFLTKGIEAVTFLLDKLSTLAKKSTAGKIYDFAKTSFTPTKTVGDAIIRPNGQIIETDPRDTIIATKNGFGGVSVYIENVNGLDPEEISRALRKELINTINY